MNASQQVQYRKLMDYLSPFDSLKINSQEYQQLKKKTVQSAVKKLDTDANQFILQQLGVYQTAKFSNQQRISTYNPNTNSGLSPKKQQIQNSSERQNGRSNSVQSFNYSNNNAHSNQTSRVQITKRGSVDIRTPNKVYSNQSSRHSYRQKNQSWNTPSNFSKVNLGTNETESFIVNESNNSSQIKGLQQNNQSNKLVSLNISNIIENINQENSHHQHNIITKSVVYQEPVKYAWSEIKFKGKLCEGRSFSQAVIYNGEFYFYGGYDASKGVYKDFVCLSFSSNGPSSFHQVELSEDNKETPGRLCRHGAVLKGNIMVIFGGRTSSIQSSNCMFEYSFEERKFKKIDPVLSNPQDLPDSHQYRQQKNQMKSNSQVLMPCIDSHSMLYDQNKELLIISGGFLGEVCEYSIDVFTFNFSSNSWTYIPSQTSQEKLPKPRGSHGSVLQNNNLFIFGGTDGENILEDMWYFSMDSHTWTQIDFTQQTIQPGPRSGIQMMEYQGYFFVFGGFKSLINERNDLVIFDSRKMEWIYQSERKEIIETIQTQSACSSPSKIRQQSNNKGGIQSISKQILNQYRSDFSRQNSQQAFLYQHGSSSQLGSPFSKKILVPLLQKDELSQIMNKNRENRIKVINEKKMQLLKQFEVSEEMRNQLISPIPILQSMRSSLNLLSSCNQSHRYDQINETQLKLQNFQNTQSLIRGKHPGARDGYLSAVIGDKLIIFGGDRHRMSLNDTYQLDLKMLLEYLRRL
ncbi:Sm protein (macronuclear) [Tetrahymena thermophila SB210]|uniref:Sm protein n=1 Tax=Tetrahymena thermophila (strain SB210) TaxID=312017 RepID=I7MDB2_TETTS|nr:Sm protein [Tetrahymena thermophila SB210]EAR86118.2 Sm protein [Tetrahymena thermophila SB210]|eukprot:XP_976713.2 Sm protein [Tetrahymena thermophila SB210]